MEDENELSDERVEAEVSEAASVVTNDRIVEALLFASDVPVPASRIAQILGVGDARDVKRHVDALNTKYEEQGMSFRIEFVAKGFQIMTLPVYDRWVSELLDVRRRARLSAAALETLAVVAYKQPVLRAEIEAIRGVACGDTLNRLREMNLVKIVGRAEELGRPMLYGTTRNFLEVFGLGSIDDLPEIEEVLPRPAPVEARTTDDHPGEFDTSESKAAAVSDASSAEDAPPERPAVSNNAMATDEP